jgi:hypothetical protein
MPVAVVQSSALLNRPVPSKRRNCDWLLPAEKTVSGVFVSTRPTLPLYGWVVESTALPLAAPPPNGMFWNSRLLPAAFVAAEIVSPGPCTASSNGMSPIGSAGPNESPRLVETNRNTRVGTPPGTS